MHRDDSILPPSPRRVVYVVGKGRSGSTLVDDLLGAIPGVASLGELRLVWSRGFTPGYRCACGALVPECPVWSTAVPAAAGGTDAASLAAADGLQSRVQRWSHVPAVLAGRVGDDDRRLGEMLGALYDSVAASLGVNVLVDSSKWPLPSGSLGLVPGWDAAVVHLVRDPRAVAHSYRRRKGGDGQPELPRFGALHTAASWTARNGTVELGRRAMEPGRVRVLRYEDLAARPRAEIRSLGAWLGVPDPDAAFVDDVTVELPVAHLVGGNPRRLERGPVEIRPDTEWADQEPTMATRLADLVTAPLRRRYGYSGAVG